jgi:hypothetical protein
MNVVNKEVLTMMIAELATDPIKILGFDNQLHYYTLSVERIVLNAVLSRALSDGAGRYVHHFGSVAETTPAKYKHLFDNVLGNSIKIINEMLKTRKVLNHGAARILHTGPGVALIIIAPRIVF